MEQKITCHQITIEIPEKVLLTEKTDAVSFGREILVLAAVKLFEIGRLSSRRASELAGRWSKADPLSTSPILREKMGEGPGMSRVEFLLNLSHYKVFHLAAEHDDLENPHS